MAKTIVGLFASFQAANEVKSQLLSEGIQPGSIQVVANDSSTMQGGSTAETTEHSSAAGVGEKIGTFFRSLTGGDEHAHNHYATGINEGKALLTVTTSDEEAGEMAQLLREHGALDINAGTATAVGTTYQDRSATTADAVGETSIPIVEEELVVGKREVDRGGVRIYSHVVERPAEANVALHEERITMERHAVNRPATAADFTGGTYEVRATGEEAIVGKTSRVVEEVTVGKQASDHTETVHDSVRKTEVEVEQFTGEPNTTDRLR